MKYLSLFICISLLGLLGAWTPPNNELILAFYNVENLFDTVDDPDRADEDFLPEGRYQWTSDKYQRKLNNVAKAIESMGNTGPDILGLAEVENERVIKDLIDQTPIKFRKYRYIHEESPDKRGIDVAFIYDPKRFSYDRHQALPVFFPDEQDYSTRSILLVEGRVRNEALYVIVNHWPSRRDGPEISEPRRMLVAQQVSQIVATLKARNDDANIVIMGDFNDDPFNPSVLVGLNAKLRMDEVEEDDFFNPMFALHDEESSGTLTYRGKWNLFDQIILSEDLLDKEKKLRFMPRTVSIHHPDFLTVGYGRSKDHPRRCIYRGKWDPKGTSDHFPVMLKLRIY